MKYLYRLLCLALITCILGACGGGGSAGCSVAVGGLACAGGGSGGGGGGGAPTPVPSFAKIYDMSGSNSNHVGITPSSALIYAKGNFYGTTEGSTGSSYGSVFSMSPNGTPSAVHTFSGADGALPFTGLTLASDGNLYGVTSDGGANGGGTVFQVTISSSGAISFTSVYDFGVTGTDGVSPMGTLVAGAGNDHALYGTTLLGGTNGDGTVFRIQLLGGTSVQESVIYNFDPALQFGIKPLSGLIIDSHDVLYGTTSEGGIPGFGTIFSMDLGVIPATGLPATPVVGVPKLLYAFKGRTQCISQAICDGDTPSGSLTFGVDGKLYGTTTKGGKDNIGTFFALPTTGTVTSPVLYSFQSANDGANPNGNLIQLNGVFYGTTPNGGDANGDGTIFAVTTSGSEKLVHLFDMTNGANPSSGLVVGGDGYLYGTTPNGGANSQGTIYRFYPSP